MSQSSSIEERLFISRSHDSGDGEMLINVSLGPAELQISELRVRDASNSATPFVILGKGNSRLYITAKQLLQFLGQYARFTIHENVEWKVEDTNHEFYFRRKVREDKPEKVQTKG